MRFGLVAAAIAAHLFAMRDARAESTPEGDLRAPARVDPEAEALSKAMEALQRGKLPLALLALGSAKRPDDVLLDYRAWVRARILLGLGQREKARQALLEIKDGPPEGALCKPTSEDAPGRVSCRHPLAVDVAELMARTYELTAPKKAADRLAALPPDGRLWWRAVNLYRRSGDEAKAAALEERLLVEAAESPEAYELAAALGAAKVAAKLASPERRRARIFRLLDSHDNGAAKREADALAAELPKKHALQCDLAYASGKAARKSHAYGPAIESLHRAKRECSRLGAVPEAVEILRRASLLETEVLAIRGDMKGAKQAALFLADKFPDHPFAAAALFNAAELFDQRGFEDEAAALYRRILLEHVGGELTPEAAWRLAFSAFRRDDTATARSMLEAILETPAAPTIEGARARYWLARLAEGAGRADEACAAYEGAALQPPLTFYAWLAADRLERTLPECGAGLKTKLVSLRDDTPRSSTTAAEIARYQLAFAQSTPFLRAKKLAGVVGFKPYASLEINMLKHEGMSQSELVALALAYDAIGDHRQAQLVLRIRAQGALSVFPRGGALPVWRAAYSRPFEDEVEGAAAEQKLDPWLLYALAREESTFDPAVISWAGAVGLVQLMPATARSIFPSLKLGRYDPAKLTDPLVNMRLGAHVLSAGLKFFERSVPLALVAYNAGPGLAAKQLPEVEQPFDLWVETIPVKETRRYVKRVVQTYGIYRFLYDRTASFIDLPDTVRSRRRR